METNLTEVQRLDEEFPPYPEIQLAWLIFLSVILVLGVLGNSLILRVYSTKTLTTCTHVLIMALAVTDLSICLLLPLDICSLALLLMKHPVPLALQCSRYVRTSFIGASITMTVLIAVDRRDSVCRPHRRFLTPRRGKVAVWLGVVLSFALAIPYLTYKVTRRPSHFLVLLAVQCVNFTITLLVVTVCYQQVFTKIRRHVKVFAVSAASGPATEWSTRIQPPTAKPNLGVMVTGTSVMSVGDRSRDGCSNHNGLHIAMENRCPQTSENQVSGGLESNVDAHCDTRDTIEEGSTGVAHPNTREGQAINRTSVDQSAVKNEHTPRVDVKRVPLRHDPNGSTALQRKTTLMLFVTSLVFLLSWLPYWISIALYFIGAFGVAVNQKIIDTTQALLIILYANNALNPVIYGIANRRFRKDCLNVFRKVKATN